MRSRNRISSRQLRSRPLASGTGSSDQLADAQSCIEGNRVSRAKSFGDTCQERLTSVAGGYALLADPTAVVDATPEECDRLCGPQCKELKASVTGMRLEIQTRSSN